MVRLMYARSLLPSDASMSRRISSSADASSSTSASLRCAYSVTSAMATSHHIPTGRWADASHENAERGRPDWARRRACGRATQRLTPSLGPRRLPHRSRHNLAIATRCRTIGEASAAQTDSCTGTLWHPNRYPRPPHPAPIARRFGWLLLVPRDTEAAARDDDLALGM